ncbi:MAG TPA: hypothetical protein VM639_00905 [Dongiaceae bacterium]|nr:hypothetical protein [Dongiaceae bacterium]
MTKSELELQFRRVMRDSMAAQEERDPSWFELRCKANELRSEYCDRYGGGTNYPTLEA